MQMLHNVDLAGYTTFGISAKAQKLLIIETAKDLADLASDGALRAEIKLVIGGGSNILFTKDVEETMAIVSHKGINFEKFSEDAVLVRVAAGENWHDLVTRCVENGYAGIENLALIPGSVGGGPVQNIGAYGAELKETLESVTYLDLVTGEFRTLTQAECQFGYRDSIFKRELKGRALITEVTLKLKSANYQLKLEYGDIKQVLVDKGINLERATIKDVYDAVCQIRSSKLPDPKEIGNVGSFFKNPVISKADFDKLQIKYPTIPSFPAEDSVKVPAAWLIDKSGWKGFRRGDAGVHINHALVLVNYGGASGAEILQLAEEIIADVDSKFGIKLSPEVNIY